MAYTKASTSTSVSKVPFEGEIKLGDLEGSFKGTLDLSDFVYTPKVTAIHSLNSYLSTQDGFKVLYNPMLKDCPQDISKYVSKCEDTSGGSHRFAAVWDGYFDAEVEQGKEYFTGTNSRALELLEKDILVYHEEVDINGLNSVTQDIELAEDTGANVPRYGALTAIYKALGQYKYRIQVAFREDASMSLANSPVGQYIASSLLTPDIDASEGEAWVWVGRSNCNDYLVQALEDNIIFSNSRELQTLVGAEKPDKELYTEFQDDITLGEFCVYVQRLAEVYGEPVLTEKEKQILLQYYGASLPYYLEEDVYDAVEYLAAKGILEPSGVHSVDFSAKLTVDEMLDILMRLKDTGSRYTFKEITPTIDVELANKGYYESQTSSVASPVYGIQYEYENTDYYDYVIVPTPGKTMIVTNKKPNVEGLCLQSWYGSTNVLLNADVTSKGYIHFTISKDMAEDYEKNGLLRIGWQKESGARYKKYFTIEPIGGVFKYKASLWSSKHKLQRTAFKEAGYVDNTRSPSTSTSNSQTIRLAVHIMDNEESDDTIPIVFTVHKEENFEQIKICDKTLKDILGEGGTVTYNDDDDESDGETWTVTKEKISTDFYAISVKGPKSLTTFKGQFSVEPGATTGMTVHKLFLKAKNECLLVNYDWLVQTGIVYQKVKLKGGVYCLTTKYNNVYLCPEQQCIIVGQMIIRFMDSERVLYHEKDGELYVDLQALVGWSGEFNTLYSKYSEGGQLDISLPDLWANSDSLRLSESNVYGIKNMSVYYPIEACDGRDLLKKTSTVLPVCVRYTGAEADDVHIYYNFAMSYNLANYFIVQDGSNSVYLFVFKNANAKAEIDGKWQVPKDVPDLKDQDEKARKKLKTLLGVADVPGNWLVQMYRLGNQHDTDNYGITKIQSGNATVSYLYELKDRTNSGVWQDRYFNSTKDFEKKKDALLPFWRIGDKLYNTNLNTFTYSSKLLKYGRFPAIIYGKDKGSIYTVSLGKPLADYSITSPSGISAGSITASTISSENLIMHPAPTGCLQEIFDFWSIDYEKANLYAKRFNVFSGTCPLIYNERGNLYLRYKEGTRYGPTNILMSSISSNDITSLYVLGASKAGYTLGLKPEETLTSKDNPLTVSDVDPILGEGTPVIDFDWDNFTFTNLIHNLDSGLSIILILCLNLIPRVFMFVCMFLIMLAVVKDSPIVKRFCEKVFDPYKLLTFGGRDITSINAFKLLWDSIVGLAIFGLFMDGAILQFIAWCARAIAAIVSK